MIFDTAYHTTACSGYRYTKLIEDVTKANLATKLGSITVDSNFLEHKFDIKMIRGGNANEDTITFFNHPIFIKDGTNPLVPVIDVRSFGKYNRLNDEFIARNKPEYSWAVKRAILNKLWVDGGYDALRDLSTIPLSVFSNLISESISRRFSLDLKEKLTISILSSFFYYCLFTNNLIDEDKLNRIVGNITRANFMPASLVYDTISDLKTISSIEELCDVIKTKVNNQALNELNKGTFITIVSGNWIGTNARENLAVGLEHMPTWILIVAASLESATYKRSTLSKISQIYNKKGVGENFLRALNQTIGGKDAVSDKANFLVD